MFSGHLPSAWHSRMWKTSHPAWHSVTSEQQQQQQRLQGLQLGLAAASACLPALRQGEVVGRPLDYPQALRLCTSKGDWIAPSLCWDWFIWQSKNWDTQKKKKKNLQKESKDTLTVFDSTFMIICNNSVLRIYSLNGCITLYYIWWMKSA